MSEKLIKEDWIPYTYFIIHKPSKLKYYGVRFAKGCNPKDLWKTYWTSSKYVKALIQKDGPESFFVEIRKKFADVSLARNWEHRVLKKLNVVNREDFLNKTDNKSIKPLYGDNNPSKRIEVKDKIRKSIKERYKKFPNPLQGRKTPSNVKEKQSQVKKGNLNPFFERTHSKETIKFLSERQQGDKNSFFGKMHSQETKKKMSEIRTGVIKPKINCPLCGNQGAPHVMKRWHFNNCKKNYENK